METDSKIYVAGHRGLVGAAILRHLRAAGYPYLVYRTRRELDLRMQRPTVDFLLKQKPDYVFAAAATVGGILANSRRPADFIRDNLLIAANLIDGAHAAGVKKICFLGSSCIYPRHAPQPIPESALLTGPPEPTNDAYAVAKIAAWKMLQAYRKQYGLASVFPMPSNVYGPGDNFDLQEGHVLAALMRKFMLARWVRAGRLDRVAKDVQRHGAIPPEVLQALDLRRMPDGELVRRHKTDPAVVIWGTGAPRREFLYVDDLAAACVLLMATVDEAVPVNVGTGEDISIRELATVLQDLTDYDGPIRWDDTRPDGMPRKLLDVERIRRLGWQARTSLKDGIRKTLAAHFS